MLPFTLAAPIAAVSASATPGAQGAPGAGVAGAVGVLGSWGRPPDRPSQVALGIGVLLLAAALAPGGCAWLASLLDFSGVSDVTRRRRFLGVAGFVVAFLSLGYIAFYLRGGPRDPLAPVYWLQGRALSHGELSWTAADPVASFRTGHLLGALPDRVAGLLPPGYPLLLGAGFLVGAPMLVGPLLAATLLVVTWALAREMAEAAGANGERAEAIARTAVGLSMVSAALRLFTADALPYGATAVAVTAALAAALRGRRLGDRRFLGLAGLAVGGVVATQPASAIAVGAIVAAVALGTRDRRAVVWLVAAALPGTLLLLAANRAASGHALGSPAALYASVFGDVFGPPPQVAGAAAHGRVVTLLMQLRAHLADVDNLEPLALLALVPLFGRARSRPALLAGLVVAGQLLVTVIIAARSGGVVAGPVAAERSLVSVVPVEHALMAIALAQVFPGALPRAAVGVLGLALAGFSLHTAHDHQRIAAAGLGRPRYEPDVVRDASVSNGLLYFDDDDGFELAFDPETRASHEVEAVRMRGDDHDRLLYDLLGHPQIHRYTASTSAATVVAWTPPGAGSDTWRFEAESDWPSSAASSARVEVSEGGPPCASDGHGLTVTPLAAGGQGSATLSLPVPRGATPPERRSWSVVPRALQRGVGGSAVLELVAVPGGPPLARWTWDDAAKTPGCVDLPGQTVELGGDRPRAWLVLHATGGAVTLDKTTLRGR
jgi:hypothetical protein